MIEHLFYGFIIGAMVWGVALLWSAVIHYDEYKEKWLRGQ